MYSVPAPDRLMESLQGGISMETVFRLSPSSSKSEVTVDTRRLGPLPLIKHFLNRLKIREMVDAHCPQGEHMLSHGECVEAIVMGLFLGTHTLSQLKNHLAPYDLERLFGKPVQAEMLHDDRLGDTLDILFEKTQTCFGDIAAQAISEFRLSLKSLNMDGTKILLYGDYDTPECFGNFPIPVPKRGWNPQGRGDLKQLSFTLTVQEDHVPLLYSMGDGSASDTQEYLKLMQRLNTIRGDLGKSLLVADSKICAAKTLTEAVRQDLRLVTLVPESFSVRRELIEAICQKNEELPVLAASAQGDEYRGVSILQPYAVDLETGEKIETKHLWWRFLVVYSESKAREAEKRRLREKTDEREALAGKMKKFQTQIFACEADAKTVAEKWVRDQGLEYHDVTWETRDGVVHTGRGRCREKGLKKSDQVGWGVSFTVQERTLKKYRYHPDGMFVLLTTVSDRRRISDADLLESYRGRNVVEMCFAWMKGPAAVAPMFLKLPSRIVSMGFLLVIWMMVYALIQREIRKALPRNGGKAPHANNRWTDRPTARGILEIFKNVEMVRCRSGDFCQVALHHFEDRHQFVLNLIGVSELYKGNLRGATS